MNTKFKILMTGAGAPGGPGIYKALKATKSFNVFTCDMNPLSAGILLNKRRSFVIPPASDPDFIDTILELCLKNNISIILPLVTMELFKFSKHRKLFEDNGIKVLVSDYKTLDILNNKAKILSHLKNSYLPHPKFSIASSKNSLIEAIKNLGYPNNPVVIKPSIGNGSRGTRVLDPNVNGYDLLFNHKPNSIYSSLDTIIESIGSNQIPEMVVSEFLPGNELTIDTVINSGKIVEFMIRTRVLMRSGISVAGRFIDNAEVKEYISNIIYSLDISTFRGNVGFQVKQSELGEYLLLESNPRIQGTSVSAIGCGVNLPSIAVSNALGQNLKYTKKKNIYFSRYYEEVFCDE
jgi:carbamoyl-phosphate synthase large subunit